MAINVNESTKRLSEILKRWIDEKKSRSVRELSKDSGVSYPTALRAVNCEGNTTFVNAVAMLDVAATLEEKEAWLKDFHPKILNTPITPREDDTSNFNDLCSLMGERVVNEIIAYLYNDKGVNRSFLRKQYGETSEKVLERVYKLGVLIQDGDTLNLDTKNLPNLKLFSKFVSSCVRNCQYLSEETDSYALTYYIGNYNQEGLNIVIDKVVKFYQEVVDVEKEHAGDIVMEIGGIAVPLNSTEANKIKG